MNLIELVTFPKNGKNLTCKISRLFILQNTFVFCFFNAFAHDDHCCCPVSQYNSNFLHPQNKLSTHIIKMRVLCVITFENIQNQIKMNTAFVAEAKQML